MSKYTSSACAAFATQSAEGTFDTTLDGITTSLSGDPDGTDEGLVLGDPATGVKESGIIIEVERESKEQSQLGSSLTRPISHWLGANVSKFSFAFPFCGSRRTTTATPVDNDFPFGTGVKALLGGVGFTGSAWGSGVGYSYVPGISVPYFSSLVYANGWRLELLDCLVSSLKIEFVPNKIPIAVADIVVGSIKDPIDNTVTTATLPSTLDYGTQATVSAPVLQAASHAWIATRGFSKMTVTVEPGVEDFDDSNAANGIVLDFSQRIITVEAELWSDDASNNEVAELAQAFATQASDLAQMSFTVGTAASGSDPAKAVKLVFPTPELKKVTPMNYGRKAGAKVILQAVNSTANNEMQILTI